MEDSPNWLEITMKYSGKCIECSMAISVGEIQLWAKGIGVKHIQCPDPQQEPKSKKTVEEYKREKDKDIKFHDPKIYPFLEALSLPYCQICGTKLDTTGDKMMNLDRRSCSKCFKL